MYSSVTEARAALLTCIVASVFSALMLAAVVGIVHPLVAIVASPVLPFWLGTVAIDRRAYSVALVCASGGIALCLWLSTLIGATGFHGLCNLVAIYFAIRAAIVLRRLR